MTHPDNEFDYLRTYSGQHRAIGEDTAEWLMGDTSPFAAIEEQDEGLEALWDIAEGQEHRKHHRKAQDRLSARETLKHRLIVTVLIVTAVAAFYGLQQVLWPRNPAPSGTWQDAWSWTGLLWTVAFIPAVFETVGLYLWHSPRVPPRHIDEWVCWRYVSRGINSEALTASIEACRREMRATPLFRYHIEVVMDSNEAAAGLPPAADDLSYIIVPKDYQTEKGTKAKARALNYALWNSKISGTQTWIVHMDEESHPTPSGITGIANAIHEEQEKARADRTYIPKVGQGTIVYHRKWGENLRLSLFTLSDCIRTGSDLGRLYLSMKLGVPLFGLHGSYILVRSDVEEHVGFDIGPRGSLTEDAWWGTLAMDKGIRCRWVEGYVEEQCTEHVSDFLKQRGRWFNGLVRTSLSAPSSLRWRIVLIISMLAWAAAPIAWAYTLVHFFLGGYISPEIRALANLSLGVYIATTLIGLRVNMKEHGITRFGRKIGWTLAWLACLPLFSLLESAAVARAIVRPAKGFHVVRK